MAINGYHHIGLAVRDMEKSYKFYTKGLGGQVTMSFPMGDTGKTIYIIDLGGNAAVELLPCDDSSSESNPRWLHIALATDDTRGAYALAMNAGATAKSEPQDITLGDTEVSNAFVYGPDGECIEFFQVK